MVSKILEQINAESVAEDVAKALNDIGRVTVMIAGRTGAGKSTLINAVFHGELARTGQGRPVSPAATAYTREGIPLLIIDTRGLEMGNPDHTRQQLVDLVRQSARESDPNRHVHLVWHCVDEGPRRFEEYESNLVNEFRAIGLPVLVVVTKARQDRDEKGNSFQEVVRQLAPRANDVLRVRALAVADDDGHVKPQMGLNELIAATIKLVPEGHRQAFIAAQKVDLEAKMAAAHSAVAIAAAAAAVIGAVPIPFSDALLLVPVQVGMMSRIAVVFGLSLDAQGMAKLVASVLASVAGTMLGRQIFTGLLKLIPGAGSLIGGAIAAGTAAAITTGLGEAFAAVLKRWAEKHPDTPPSTDALVEGMKEFMAKRPWKS